MILNSDVEETVHVLNIDFNEEEYSNLMEYAQDNMPLEKLDELMVEWAMIDLLKKALLEDEHGNSSN